MRDLCVTAFGAMIVLAILWLFYRAVRTEWPESYITPSSDYGMIVNRTILYYFLFRTAPAYCTALLVGTTVTRFDGNGMAAALVGSAVFVAGTQVRHSVHVLRGNYGHRRMPMLMVTATSALGVLGAAFLGGLGPGPFVAVVPPIDEFFKSFWTSALLAIIAVVLIRRTKLEVTTARLVRRSQREVGSELINLARSTADRYCADPYLVEAVLLTENLQRPKWSRRIERIVFWRGRRSYGVMQVQADSPLSDVESVEVAVRDHLTGASVARAAEWAGWDEDSLRRQLERYKHQPALCCFGRRDLPFPNTVPARRPRGISGFTTPIRSRRVTARPRRRQRRAPPARQQRICGDGAGLGKRWRLGHDRQSADARTSQLGRRARRARLSTRCR